MSTLRAQGPVAGRDAVRQPSCGTPHPSLRRSPAWLLAAQDNGIQKVSMGAGGGGRLCIFSPFKFPYLGFDRALWGPRCRLISFCVPFLMLHLVMVY